MMLRFDSGPESGKPVNLLLLGAHCDDIEIGCGGTILKLLQRYPQAKVTWIVFSANKTRAEEARQSADAFLTGVEHKNVEIKDFKDGYLPYSGAMVKDCFESIKQQISPDIIFTHFRHDLHQDHRLVCDLTWNTFRNHLILEYEIPKYDGDFGKPNVFVQLDETSVQKKLAILFDCFKSQSNKKWFSKDLFLAIMRLRGMECAAPYNLAEGFYCRKGVLQL